MKNFFNQKETNKKAKRHVPRKSFYFFKMEYM